MQRSPHHSRFPVPEGFSVLELPESSLRKELFGGGSVLFLTGVWKGLGDDLVLGNNVVSQVRCSTGS